MAHATRTFRIPVKLPTFVFSIFICIFASNLDVYYNRMSRLTLQLNKQKNILAEISFIVNMIDFLHPDLYPKNCIMNEDFTVAFFDDSPL